MRTKYKPWAEPYIKEHPEVQVQLNEASSLLCCDLEIGAGKGAFIVELANKNSDKNYVAIERNVTCAGNIAKKLVEEKISNAKLYCGDAEAFVNNIKDNAIGIIYLNFSDPWPKKRHNKRRLTSKAYIDSYYRILKKGGEIHFKTDNDDLYNDSLELFKESKFVIYLNEEDYVYDVDSDPLTEYEIKKRNSGNKIHRIFLRKE